MRQVLVAEVAGPGKLFGEKNGYRYPVRYNRIERDETIQLIEQVLAVGNVEEGRTREWVRNAERKT